MAEASLVAHKNTDVPEKAILVIYLVFSPTNTHLLLSEYKDSTRAQSHFRDAAQSRILLWVLLSADGLSSCNA